MTDRDVLELIATQVGRLTTQVDWLTANMATKNELAEIKADVAEIKADVAGVKGDVAGVKGDLSSIKAIVIKIEHDHGAKHKALFDGHELISEKLDRIEAEVSRHEEIILRRIK